MPATKTVLEDQRDRVVCTLEAGEVLRYHASPAVRMLRDQTDAQHSWGVGVICEYLLGPDADLRDLGLLLSAANLHDTGELVCGDSPYFTKAANPRMSDELHRLEEVARINFMLPGRPLNYRLRALLKIADCLEALQWCAKHAVERPWKTVHAHTLKTRFVLQWSKCVEKYRNDGVTAEEWARAETFFHIFITNFPNV